MQFPPLEFFEKVANRIFIPSIFRLYVECVKKPLKMLQDLVTARKRSPRNVFGATGPGREACRKRGRSRAADSFQAKFSGQFGWAR
jgi:hypothetical protein